MKSKNRLLASIFLLAILLSSCATYHLSTQRLIEQLASSKTEKKINVKGNSLTEIKVLDKNENEITLPVTTQMSVRITKKDGKRTTFYFDTLILKDSLITGKKEHFFGVEIKPININYIERIELQKH